MQYFVCGHTIKDLGVAIGRMWKSDPGSAHPTNSCFLYFPFLLFDSTMFLERERERRVDVRGTFEMTADVETQWVCEKVKKRIVRDFILH